MLSRRIKMINFIDKKLRWQKRCKLASQFLRCKIFDCALNFIVNRGNKRLYFLFRKCFVYIGNNSFVLLFHCPSLFLRRKGFIRMIIFLSRLFLQNTNLAFYFILMLFFIAHSHLVFCRCFKKLFMRLKKLMLIKFNRNVDFKGQINDSIYFYLFTHQDVILLQSQILQNFVIYRYVADYDIYSLWLNFNLLKDGR